MSLRLKLSLAYVALAIMCTVALGGLGLWLQQQTYLTNLRERLSSEAQLAADAVAAPLAAGAPLEATVGRQAGITGARVTIITPDGSVLADSVAQPETMENHATRPEMAAALAGGRGEASRRSDTTGVMFLYIATPVEHEGRLIGALRLAVPLTEIEQALGRIALALVGLTVVGAVLATLLTWVVTRWLTVPLRHLTALVRQVASGELTERLPVRSRDELGDLAAGFNRMADELDRVIRAISHQRNEMSAILSGIPDGILIVDRAQRVQRINQSALSLFDMAAERVIGRPLIQVARDHELVETVAESLRRGVTTRRVVERGSDPRALSVTVTPIAAGELAGALVTLHDISELRRLEQVRRQFVANVSHELRTPLTTIKLMVETLQVVSDDAALTADLLRRINTEIDSLTQLVRELLDLARLESGQAPLTVEWQPLAGPVQRAVARLAPQAERLGVTLTVAPEVATLPPAPVDRERIEGVVVNLLHNAIKFTPPGGAVTVGGAVRDDEVWVWVRDTGIGIAPDDLPRIFERFYKVDKARSTGGTGLGLAIVKHTVQAHGGRVWAESAPGAGSTFVVALPLAPRPAALAAAAP